MRCKHENLRPSAIKSLGPLWRFCPDCRQFFKEKTDDPPSEV